MDTRQADIQRRDAHATEGDDNEEYKRGNKDSDVPLAEKDAEQDGDQYGQEQMIQEHKFQEYDHDAEDMSPDRNGDG